MAMRDETKFLHVLELGVSATLPDSARDARKLFQQPSCKEEAWEHRTPAGDALASYAPVPPHRSAPLHPAAREREPTR